MSAVLIGIVVVVVLLAAWLFLQTARNLGKEEESRARMEQLQRDLQTLAGQTQNFSQQLGQLAQNVTKSLEGVTGALQRGVTDSATIAAQAQTAMASELKNSRETLGQIQQQLGAVQQAGHQMSQTAQTLQNILGGAKSRGSLGEVALERLLEDALPRERYQRQYRFSSGEAADAVIFLRDKLLPIDSKFPLDAFRRISEHRSRNVIAVSPNTLYAHLQIILMGLQGMQIEENAERLHASLAGMQKQLDNFTEVFEKVGTHLKNAQQSYSESEKRLDKAKDTLDGLLGAGESNAALESAEAPPALPAETSAKQGA